MSLLDGSNSILQLSIWELFFKRSTSHRILPVSMSCQSSYFGHGRITPDNYLIERVSMCANNFIDVFGPHEIANLLWKKILRFLYFMAMALIIFHLTYFAHLGSCVNAVECCSRKCIPKSDTPISCTTSRSQQTMLVWRPRDSLFPYKAKPMNDMRSKRIIINGETIC